MAITAADLIEPKGPVTAELFPNTKRRDLEAKLAEYITAAYLDSRVAAQTGDTDKNKAATLYCLWRVYRAVHLTMTRRPLNLTVTEKGGHAYSIDQIREMKKLADEALAELDEMVAVVVDDDEPGFGEAINRYVW